MFPECSGPGTEYQLGCDLCICREGGVPACTHRQCDSTPGASAPEIAIAPGPVLATEVPSSLKL